MQHTPEAEEQLLSFQLQEKNKALNSKQGNQVLNCGALNMKRFNHV